MRAPQSALRRLGIEPREQALAGWAGLCLLCLGAASFALLNASETLFLKRVGVRYLPWALLASSAVLVATTGMASRVLAAGDRPRWLPRALLGLAITCLPFAVLLHVSEHALVLGGLVLVARQVLSLGLMVFWIALSDLVTGRQAKRLFAPLSAGITIGASAGSFGSDPVVGAVGFSGLLIGCAGLLVLAAVAAWRLRGARTRRLERGLAAASGPRRARAGEAAGVGALGLWRESRLFRLLTVVLLCGGLLSPVLYFEFSYVADAATQGPHGEQALLGLYAQFRGWLNVAMLGMQLWLSSRLYRSIGLPLSLALWPVTYVLGFGWLGLSFALPAAVTALGTGRLSEDGVAGAALRVLFNLFPERVRATAASLLEGPVTRTGSVLGNSGVLLALALDAGPFLPYLAFPVAAFWLMAALVLWRAFPRLLLEASAQRSLVGAGEDKAKLLDAGTVRALAAPLTDPDPALCAAAIDLVRDAEPRLAVDVLAGALERAPAATRPLLVDALHRLVEPLPAGSVRSSAGSAALARVLERPEGLEDEARADLLQVYARLSGGPDAPAALARTSASVLRRALGDRAAAVRLAAISELHRRGAPPPGVADLDAVLAGALAGRDVLVRRSARKELRAMLLSTEPDAAWERRLGLLAERLEPRADRAETAEALVEVARRHPGAARGCAPALVRRLDDGDPRVRAAALRFVGYARLSERSGRLLAGLASRHATESDAAREALVALGAEAATPLLVEGEFGSPSRRDAVLAVLRELELDAPTLEKLYERQLATMRRALVLRAALGSARAPLVARRLQDRAIEAWGACLALLAALHDDERLAVLERRLRRVESERQRDLLIEALDALLPPDARAELLPLLESTSWEERGALAAAALGQPVPPLEVAWSELRGDADEMTQRLALSAVESEAAMGDASAMTDPMHVAVLLKDVPAFGRLSTQQLVRLAEALELVGFEAGATVFEKGDEGDCLFIVLEGEVELRRGGRSLIRHQPGHFFGELSTLDGIPRAASAHALTAVRLLRLDREDLFTLMEEVPALGIGLSQYLSLLVRELEGRLEG